MILVFGVFNRLEFDKMINPHFSKKGRWIFNEQGTNGHSTGTRRYKRSTTNKKYK